MTTPQETVTLPVTTSFSLRDYKLSVIEAKIRNEFRCYTWILWFCVIQASTSIVSNTLSKVPDRFGLSVLLMIEAFSGFAAVLAAWAKVKWDIKKQNYAIGAWLLRGCLTLGLCAYILVELYSSLNQDHKIFGKESGALSFYLQENFWFFIAELYLLMNLGIMVWLVWNTVKLKDLMIQRNELKLADCSNDTSGIMIVVKGQPVF